MNSAKLLSALIFLFLIISCSDSEEDMMPTPTPEPTPEPLTPMIQLGQNSTLGSILTDENGMTLYFFTKDAFDESTCTGGCTDNWPIYNIENLVVGNGLQSSDFASITRADGTGQTTYKGWPLYYFASDAAAGDIKGEGVSGIWYAAKPDYTILLVNNQLTGADGVNYNSNYEVGEEEVQYFVDDQGRTLYAFIRDEFEINNYTESDFSNDATWPIFDQPFIKAPSILDPSLFKMIDVHGRSQLTYKGWPLYYFGGDDMQRGSNKGVSVPSPGVWPIVFKEIEAAKINCDTGGVSYAGFIQPLIDSGCALSGCHSGGNAAAGISLTQYDGVKDIADSGQLVGVVSWAAGFTPMPRGQDQFDQCTIDQITAWVDAGAPEN